MSCVRVSGLPCALAPNLSSKVCHLIRGNVYSTTYFALRIEGHIHQFPIQFICNVDRVKSFHVNVECPTATGGYDWFSISFPQLSCFTIARPWNLCDLWTEIRLRPTFFRLFSLAAHRLLLFRLVNICMGKFKPIFRQTPKMSPFLSILFSIPHSFNKISLFAFGPFYHIMQLYPMVFVMSGCADVFQPERWKALFTKGPYVNDIS